MSFCGMERATAYSSLLPEDRTEYVFTDISSMFLHKAKGPFASYPFVDYYTVLDIEKEPDPEVWLQESFDVILASYVIHATASLQSTLGRVRYLLAPWSSLAFLKD